MLIHVQPISNGVDWTKSQLLWLLILLFIPCFKCSNYNLFFFLFVLSLTLLKCKNLFALAFTFSCKNSSLVILFELGFIKMFLFPAFWKLFLQFCGPLPPSSPAASATTFNPWWQLWGFAISPAFWCSLSTSCKWWRWLNQLEEWMKTLSRYVDT